MVVQTKQIWSKVEKKAWRLPDELTVTQWADENRVLDPDTSAEPGPYRSARTPYMRGPMDAFTDDEVEEIDVMSASQVAKSTAIQNMIGYTIDQDPGPAMYVVPREKDVDYTTQKIYKPMVNLSPALRSHISDSPRDLMGDFFTFDRMTLYFAWAGSPAEMAQKAIKYLFFDEPDKYPPFAGKEANPIDLAVKRTRTFWDRKIVKMCTPTTQEGYINVSYMMSNKQQYYTPCLHCGEFWVFKFGRLKLPKTLREPDKIIESGDVWYECEFCAARIYEERKAELAVAGRWIPEGQTIDADGQLHGRPKRTKRHSGFQLSVLVSPWVSWAQVMADWFRANTEEGIAIGKLLDFHNATLGEPFKETGKKLKASEVRKLTGGFDKGTVPADTLLLVASADYHKSRTRGIVRINYEVRGFTYNQKNYIIDSGIVHSFDDLDKAVLLRTFPFASAPSTGSGQAELAVMALFVDSGFLSDDVYDYARRHPGMVFPTKGLPGPRLKPLTPSDLDTATERRLSYYKRKKYRGMQLMIVDTSYFKGQVTSWVEPMFDADGKIIAEPLTLFYDQIPSYYFTEFTNEQRVRVRDRRGNAKWVWQPVTTGAQTHALDTAVLAAAAGYYKGVQNIRRPGDTKHVPAALRRGKRGERRKKKRPRRPGWLDNLPKL